MDALTVLAPAKLNLSLDIVGRMPNGYHELDSVMLAVDLYDTLTLTRRGEGVRLFCDDPALPTGEDNLVLKAVRAFFAEARTQPGGLEIVLHKNIPSQAGLAGGSADAAAALVGLNQLYGANMSTEKLARIGLGIGSDLPFCLMGGISRAGGRGETFTPLPMPPPCVFLIAKPSEGMSTRLAFELYAQRKSEPARRTPQLVSVLHSGSLEEIGGCMSNAFEDALPLPGAREIKSIMLRHGALGAAMTGSGTAVSGLFPQEEAALDCLEKLRGTADFACIAHPLPHGPKIMP